MILHTVNKSPFASRCLSTCVRFVAPGDAVVLLEDGVYAASRGIESALDGTGCPIFAIAADVSARGLTRRVRDDIKVIDYDDFVHLCTQYAVVKNWS